jgi:nicotinamidase-related amidase
MCGHPPWPIHGGILLKPALLVIDIQNEWLGQSKTLRASAEKRVENVNAAIRWFRDRSLPLAFIYHTDRKDGPTPGTRAFEFLDSIDVRTTDTRITKNFPNAFRKTELEAFLNKHGCDTVILSGLSATWCVMGTFFGAIDCDIAPFLLKGGVSSDSEEGVKFAEELCGTKTLHDIEKALG